MKIVLFVVIISVSNVTVLISVKYKNMGRARSHISHIFFLWLTHPCFHGNRLNQTLLSFSCMSFSFTFCYSICFIMETILLYNSAFSCQFFCVNSLNKESKLAGLLEQKFIVSLQCN